MNIQQELIFPSDKCLDMTSADIAYVNTEKLIHKLDVLGIIFWTLNRAEEYFQIKTDKHNRVIEANLHSVMLDMKQDQ